MTRRHLFGLPLALGMRMRAQHAFPGVSYRDYSRCLPDYLRDLARQAYEVRNRALSQLTSPEAIRQRQQWVRQTFWKLVGGEPERTPLSARTMGGFERAAYRVEKVLYESRPNFHVTANLYIPKTGRPPYPGVLFQMGHSLNGKAADTYQSCCQGLVQLGFLVLAFDPTGQGERVYYPNESLTRTRLASADEEHTLPGKQMLLYGDTSSRLQVWDAVRSLDYLASHPLVDPSRLASTGQSGGGTLTMLLAAVDDRLRAAVVSSGNTEGFACADFNPPGSTDDAEQNLIGSGPLGFDRWDLLYPMAPKPLLITVSDKDFFGTYSSNYLRNGWEEFQKLQKIYDVLGHHENLAWKDTPLPHGLSYDSRLHIYNWFLRHLRGEKQLIEQEPPVTVESDQILWVSDTGNVVKSFHGETPFTLNRKRVVESRPASLAEMLVIEQPKPARATVLRRVPSRGLTIEAVEVASAKNVWLPAWRFVPDKPDSSKPTLVSLEPGGRNVRWHERELYQEIAKSGFTVCVPDLRGLGDLTPEFGRGAARYAGSHENEDNYSWASLILGRPLVGQRVTDILAVVRALDSKRVVVTALGKMTVPALFAAALEARIEKLYLAGGLLSFRSLVETEQYTYPFANFAPGILNHTDLPQVTASIAPRRVVLAGAVDAQGRQLDPADVRTAYSGAGNLEVLPDPGWDLRRILQMLG